MDMIIYHTTLVTIVMIDMKNDVFITIIHIATIIVKELFEVMNEISYKVKIIQQVSSSRWVIESLMI